MWTETTSQRVSHFFVVIDPIRLLGADNYFTRVERFIAKIKSSAPFQKGNEVLIPGELEHRSIHEKRENGISLTHDLLTTIKRLAQH